jgi:hypothetical protein
MNNLAEVEKHLEKSIEECVRLINYAHKTDAGDTLLEFARGAYKAYTETLELVKEKQDE